MATPDSKDYPELETPYRALEATIYQTGEGERLA